MIDEKRAKKYCSEDINKMENYEKAITDKTQTWDCHHRLEIKGKFRNSTELLKKCGLYYNVPAWQLIFLTHKEHRSLHSLGNTYRRGKSPWNKGKTDIYSTETIRKMSEAKLGKLAWNKGKVGIYSAETLQKIREANLGTHWWNNGIICKQAKECPGPEWKRGRL